MLLDTRSRPLEADIPVGQFEAGFAVVVLLGHDAVQPDRTAGQIVHSSPPDRHAKPTAPVFRLDDVEPQEAEAVAITPDRPRRCRLTVVRFGDQEAGRIGDMERDGIAPAGVPPLTYRPIQHLGQFGPAHGPYHGHPVTLPVLDPRNTETIN